MTIETRIVQELQRTNKESVAPGALVEILYHFNRDRLTAS